MHPADTTPFPVGEAVLEEGKVRKKISNSSQLDKPIDFMCTRLKKKMKSSLYGVYYFSVWQNVILKIISTYHGKPHHFYQDN